MKALYKLSSWSDYLPFCRRATPLVQQVEGTAQRRFAACFAWFRFVVRVVWLQTSDPSRAARVASPAGHYAFWCTGPCRCARTRSRVGHLRIVPFMSTSVSAWGYGCMCIWSVNKYSKHLHPFSFAHRRIHPPAPSPPRHFRNLERSVDQLGLLFLGPSKPPSFKPTESISPISIPKKSDISSFCICSKYFQNLHEIRG